MNYPVRVGEAEKSFPFVSWAMSAGFDYPETARHLFDMMGSAAEAFLLRPFTRRAGVRFTPDSAVCDGVSVFPQRVVSRYRTDFAVHGGLARLALEVDGLSFHHRAAEQIQADYLRERRIAAAGYVVVRFTAAETFRDPVECWHQIDVILAARGGA